MRKNYLWYQFFRYVVKSGLHVFYKHIRIEGRENIPENKPVLFVPNHQNSFIDALLVVCHTSYFIYFLTRAESFRPKPVALFLKSLNLLPVYRVRDGFSSVLKNEETFEICYQRFKKNDAVLIFPEANHDLKRRIRPLSKGFTRIVFGAMEKTGWQMDLHVIPVGINYSSHRKSNTPISIHFGEPILAKNYREQWQVDENAATESLKEETSRRMKTLVTHVRELREYPLHELLLDVLEPNREILTKPEIMNSRAEIVSAQATDELIQKAKNLLDKLKAGKDDVPKIASLAKRASFLNPLAALCRLNCWLPSLPIRYMLKNVIQDRAFDASIKFLLALILFPFFFLTIGLLIFLVSGSAAAAFIYIAFSFLSVILLPQWCTFSRWQKKKEIQPDLKTVIDYFKDMRTSKLFKTE